jgi:cytochrome c5
MAWRIPILVLTSVSLTAGQSPPDIPLPEGKGRELVERVCTNCHSSAVFAGNPGGVTHWNLIVAQMIQKGAAATDAEFSQIVQYLAERFGSVRGRTTLPDGPGRQTVERVCGNCHTAELVSDRRGDLQTWTQTVNSMRNRGAKATPEEAVEIAAYLAMQFGTDVSVLPIRVNQYKIAELQLALEIPEKEAEAIVNYRATNGRIKSWEELVRISGVDPFKLGLKRERIEY